MTQQREAADGGLGGGGVCDRPPGEAAAFGVRSPVQLQPQGCVGGDRGGRRRLRGGAPWREGVAESVSRFPFSVAGMRGGG